MHARRRFEQIAGLPDHRISLAEGSLWIAAESRPPVDVAQCLARIDALADGIRAAVSAGNTEREKIESLNEALFEAEGFQGNSTDYQNPENSFLDAVLESRRGIPITLSIVYLEIAQRLGFRSAGVGFPGHFLVKVYADNEPIIVDPFFGRILGDEDCRRRLADVAGSGTLLEPTMLEATPRKEILQRVLRNLKAVYIGQNNFEAALACSERIILLAGDDLGELRDRGLLHRELKRIGPALHDLERYLAFSPDDPHRDALDKIVLGLREQVRRMN